MISKANLRFHLSGGEQNTDPAKSIGGDMSETQLRGGLNKLFADVRGVQAETGWTDYRCIYFWNADPDQDGLIDPAIWLSTKPTTATFSIGVDPVGKNGSAQLIAKDTDAPGGVGFEVPETSVFPLWLPEAPYTEGEWIPLWVRRITPKGASIGTEVVVLRLRGETY